jgi:hypothetical protein
VNVIIQKRNKNTDEGISFPALQCWNPVTQVATLAAEFAGRRVSCRIRITDLAKKYQIAADEPMKSISEYRPQIEEVIKKLIDRKSFEEDGSIMINYDDL